MDLHSILTINKVAPAPPKDIKKTPSAKDSSSY